MEADIIQKYHTETSLYDVGLRRERVNLYTQVRYESM